MVTDKIEKKKKYFLYGYLFQGKEGRIHQLSTVICTLLGIQTIYILCVQEVGTPIYIMSYYINWGNYFLDTQY